MKVVRRANGTRKSSARGGNPRIKQTTRGTYGPKRMQDDLKEHGIEISQYRTRKIRTKLGIRCKQVKKFKVTTDSKHSHPVAENLLNQAFQASSSNQVWVTDITYIPTDEGWLYLSGHKDIFTKDIVSYAMSDRMIKQLIIESLFRAIAAERSPKGLIHHSDRGSQYCAPSYRKLLDQFGMTSSMNRKGNCYDNAPMESIWGLLKTEQVHHRKYRTRQEARREVTKYIEVFCGYSLSLATGRRLPISENSIKNCSPPERFGVYLLIEGEHWKKVKK